MKTQTVLVFLIAVLVLMAGVQAVQMATFSEAIASGALTAKTAGASGGVATSSVLSQLPAQVGGCG